MKELLTQEEKDLGNYAIKLLDKFDEQYPNIIDLPFKITSKGKKYFETLNPTYQPDPKQLFGILIIYLAGNEENDNLDLPPLGKQRERFVNLVADMVTYSDAIMRGEKVFEFEK